MPKPNKLINEKSPYLLQHAYNPVDWYPWGEEAFKKAKDEDKPIFLSIGYSTCYWCHVMEREVFEQDYMAELMNKIFVNIKVDREERPDVDKVYMSALQAMTGSGGWPMSMFLTNDLKPFYGATYVLPTSKYGMPGFDDLIQQIGNAWKTKRDEVEHSGDEIIKHIKKASSNVKTGTELTDEAMKKALEQFKRSFDYEVPGFGGAPRFPRPVGFNFLLRAYKKYNDEEALKMVGKILFIMAKGGIHDHLGGGFHRYSVDKYWIVPHFEKMLYDHAQLAVSYLEMHQITKDKFFADIAEDILEYVTGKLTFRTSLPLSFGEACLTNNELLIPVEAGSQGAGGEVKAPLSAGFYSAEDAESALDASNPHEKEEGACYVWEISEIVKLLGEEDAKVFNYFYGVGAKGNTPQGSDPHNVFENKNILYEAKTLSDTANKFDMPTDKVYEIIQQGRKILFEVREKRPLPHLDDKILTSWNGLMISAFAKAYRLLHKTKYLEQAVNAANFILNNLYDKKKKVLMHRYRDGEAKVEGNLDDYAFFTQALIDLYETTFEIKYLELAVELNNLAVKYFYDNEEGGFWDTSGKDKSILIRTKEDYDSAEPTGNSIAIMNLLRLSQFTDNKELYKKAIESLKLFDEKMKTHPYAMPQMLCALDFALQKPKQIIIAGKRDDANMLALIEEVYNHYLPNKILIQAEPGKENKLIPFLSEIIPASLEKSQAFVCENYTCQLPVSEVEELRKLLG
jgi:uncharacterized protein YyaL (SSP411 family)